MRNLLQLAALGTAAFFSLATGRVAGPFASAVSFEPLDGETAVPADVVLRAELDFAPADASEEPLDVALFPTEGSQALPGSYEIEGTTLTFTPDAPLPPGDYTFRVDGDMNTQTTFSTISDPRLRSVTFETPARDRILVSFSQDMDPTTLTAETVVVTSGGVAIAATPLWIGGPRHELALETPALGGTVNLHTEEGVVAADGTPMVPDLVLVGP